MIYSFKCFKDDGGCGSKFDVSCSMSDILGLSPLCPICNDTKSVHRDYTAENVSVDDGNIKTVGALADKNSYRRKDV